MPKSKQREFNAHKEKMTFEGFGKNTEAVTSIVAGVSYTEFTVKESHRPDELGSRLDIKEAGVFDDDTFKRNLVHSNCTQFN